MNLLHRLRAFAAVLVSFASGGACAATMCVTNGPELQAALETAEVNGQPDVIRLATGFYVPTSLGFHYLPSATEGHSIELSGGWSSLFDNACGLQHDTTNAFQTVITTTSSTRLMFIRPTGGGNVTIRRITFLGGDAGTLDGGGLMLISSTGSTGTHLIEQCAFLDNIATRGGALRVLFPSRIHIRNSLFLDNHASEGSAVHVDTFDGAGLYFTNNTMLGNTTELDSGQAGGLHIHATPPSQALIANNNFWANTAADGVSDIILMSSGTKYIHNNNFAALFGVWHSFTGNISVEPVYEPGSLIYTPAEGSPLRDAGTRPPTIDVVPRPFERAWSTGALDINGQTRNQGRIDIGAYEATPVTLFGDGFEP